MSIAGIPVAGSLIIDPNDPQRIMTVNGWMNAKDIGNVLMHEHVLVDFIGADKVTKSRYNENEVFNIALPKLMRVKKAGCSLILECTPAYIGRDVTLLKRLSDATGITFVTNTGYYGASKEKFFPSKVYDLSAEQLAAIWTKEFTEGIEGTEIKPGFIKLGVDGAPLSEAQKKVVKAAALTHLATGLTIGIHTGNGAAAEQELSILQENGVAPDALVWIHAQNENDFTYFSRLAAKGVWIEFDNVNKGSLEHNLKFLQYMKEHSLLSKVLLSQDSGWYNVGEKDGGNFNEYTSIFSDFIPYILKNGFSPSEIDLLFKENTRAALGVKVRKTKTA